MVYTRVDSQSVFYDNFTTPVTADGYSGEIDFGVLGGCPDGQVVLNVDDFATGESVTFTLYSYDGSSYVATPYKLSGVTATGVYTWNVSNEMVTGSKLKIAHDVTLNSGSDGLKIHGHFRPIPR